MIDIIIPAYNCVDTIERAFGSLMAQTDQNFEVYVVDDCSQQNIKKVCKKFKKFLKIHYIRNKYNIGCGMSRQVGIDKSKNKFLMFMDADDMLLPYTIDIYNNLIEKNPNVEYVHSNYYVQSKDKGIYTDFKFGFTHCHGKLYNREKLAEFNIRNKPEFSRWADDGYFNSMCTELLKVSICESPTAVWTYTKGSATHSNLWYGRPKNQIFLEAMLDSCEHCLQYKDKISHLNVTMQQFTEEKIKNFNDKEKEIYQKLKELEEKSNGLQETKRD